ncbi:hypothetical protein L249_8859 [Ophiocordyceps polyrhachis-furcata BCC 54312]|uniref:DUF7907 domain-containing protein n=1 Tax=Ophiocordyceps polyrhachis-furcata BCC 54312 TaxID=1330021 RepID=A0A367L1W0_9HYPO|nr:hypothetical protein L249_8859 [Ophiocordyceps polyrhachis-furcata BCC 54312]
MKLIVLALPFLGRFAAAQSVQSKPFHLVIESSDKHINGQGFTACHTGAAIESLCIYNKAERSTFYLNTTEGSESPLKNYEPSGVLVWNLPVQPTTYSESMSFSVEPSTNVALPLFEPSPSSQYVTFDRQGRLAIVSYLDDTHSPPSGSQPRGLRNWYLCHTYYSAYSYHTLNWVLGSGKAKPQNPSCVKVEVRRLYV